MKRKPEHLCGCKLPRKQLAVGAQSDAIGCVCGSDQPTDFVPVKSRRHLTATPFLRRDPHRTPNNNQRPANSLRTNGLLSRPATLRR